MQLTIAKTKENNSNLLRWKTIKNCPSELNMMITEIIISHDNKSKIKFTNNKDTRNVGRNLRLIDKKPLNIHIGNRSFGFKKGLVGSFSGKNIHFQGSKTRQKDRSAFAFLELSLKQAQNNIHQLINNHALAL
jgi:hypothetical protein